MSEFALFMVFSIVECLALYYFMFRLFKIDWHLPSVAFASLIGSYTSYTLRISAELPSLDIFVQNALLIAFTSLLFQVPVYYAILMACISFIAYVFVQISLHYILITLIPALQHLPSSSVSTYTLQAVTALVIFIAGWYIHRKRIGFSFVPHSFFVPVKIRSYQILLLLLYVLAFLSVPVSYYLFQYGSIYAITPVAISLLLIICLYAAYRRDRKHD